MKLSFSLALSAAVVAFVLTSQTMGAVDLSSVTNAASQAVDQGKEAAGSALDSLNNATASTPVGDIVSNATETAKNTTQSVGDKINQGIETGVNATKDVSGRKEEKWRKEREVWCGEKRKRTDRPVRNHIRIYGTAATTTKLKGTEDCN